MPKVSVIMPVFNVERFLKTAIDSILNQSFKDFELILINDCSTDNSEEIINSYDDSRIKCLTNRYNKGVSYSFNKGLEYAKGEYIARADSDDIYDVDRLKEQVEILDQFPNVNICSSDLQVVNEDEMFLEFWKYKNNNDFLKAQLLFNAPIANPTLMFRRSIFENLKYDESLKRAEDYDFYLRLGEDFKVFNIAKPLMKYRRNASSLTSDTIELVRDANKVRMRALEKLNLVPTKREFLIHQLLCGVEVNVLDISGNEIIEWVEKIRVSNLKISYFLQEALEEVLIYRLSNVVSDYAPMNSSIIDSFWNYSLVKNSDLQEYRISFDEKLNKTDNLAIFGTKRMGLYLYSLLKDKNYNIVAFVDNAQEKKNKKINNVPIISQKELYNSELIDTVIVTIVGNHDRNIINDIMKNNNKLKLLSWKDFI